jgi:hypothetical protein
MSNPRDWVSELPPEYRDDLESINALASVVRDRQRARLNQALTDALECEAAGLDSYPLRQCAADLSAALGETGETMDEMVVRIEALERQVAQMAPLLAEWEIIED